MNCACNVILELVGLVELQSFFFISTCFIRISRLKFVKFLRIS